MKIPNLRWLIVGLILVATTINYVDRQAISIAEPFISKEFGLDAQGYAWIVFWFLLSYAVMQFLAGVIIDRIGTKRGFSISIVWWSIANMLHAFGTGAASLSVYRFLLGVGEAGNFPAASKAIARWFPAKERATAFGILTAGPGLGAIVAPPIIAFLIATYDWRTAFIVTGASGFVWLILWQIFYDEPEQSRFINEKERDLILDSRDPEIVRAQADSWKKFFRYKSIWGLILSRFVADGAFYFFVFFLPKYLTDVRGFNIKQIGLYAWIPFLAADVGSIAGGWTSGFLIKRDFPLLSSRKIVMMLGALGVPFAFPALFVDSADAALACISLAMFSIQFKQSALFTLPADLFPARSVATVWGISGAAGSLGGMAFTPIVGWLIKNVSYTPVFAIVSLMHIVSVLFVLILIRGIDPSESKKV